MSEFAEPTGPSIGSPRSTISACLISYNEEDNIVPCLKSLEWCDELIVVDSFSTDRTAELARSFGARVLQHKWEGHIAQKNLAIEEATSEWIIAVDCDERVTAELRDRILQILSNTAEIEAYSISRKLFYLGRWLDHGGWFPEWRIRLFQRGKGSWVGVNPHDRLEVSGKVSRVESQGRGIEAAVILHYSFRDLSHQLEVLGIGNTARVLAPSQRMSIERIPQRALYGPSL